MHWWAVILVVLGACGCSDGAETADAGTELAPCEEPVATLLAPPTGIAPGAGSGGYVVPDANRLTALRASIAAAAGGDGDDLIFPPASAAEYHVCRAPGDVVVWTPRDPAQGHAAIALRLVSAAHVIVEVPHATYELGTRDEGMVLFDELSTRALIVAGAHRCANAGVPAGCDGTTSVCGSAAPYPISDVAHTETSAFHAAHVALSQAYPADLVINLHGMSADGVHVSNGTTAAVDATSPVARITTALTQALPGHPVATCNAFPGATTTDSLCGTTNVQGRHLNGAEPACTSAATAASHRFIHLEQSRAVRDRHADVAAALSSIL